MSKWKEYILKDLVDLKQGFALNKKSDHYLSKNNSGLPLLKIGDLINGTETLFVKETIPKQFLVYPHEIIYSRTGQVGLAFMGKIGVVYNNCFKVIPYENVFPKFLFHWLNMPKTKEYIKSLATGAAQPDLNHDAFKSVKILLPPLTTQKRIASILSAYDDLIENNLKRIKLLEELAQRTYEEWFVKFRINGEQLEVGENGLPDGWERKNIEDCKIKIGDGNYSAKYPKAEEFLTEGIPFFSTREMNNGRLTTDGVKRISLEQHSTLKKGHLKSGDIILSTRGSIGKVAYVSKDFENYNISAQLVLFRCDNNEIYNSFLYYQLADPKMFKILVSFGTGTAQPQLPIKTLKLFKILYPKPEIQKLFDNLLKPNIEQINILSKQNELLKESRDILLPRLMSGKIDVSSEVMGMVAEDSEKYRKV